MKLGTIEWCAVSSMLLALTACRGESNASDSTMQTDSTSQGDLDPYADDEAEIDLPAIPTQAEADAKAESGITLENADSELEKLEQELAGDG